MPLAQLSSAGVSKSSPPTRIRSCMGVARTTLFDRSCKVLPGWWPSKVSWQECGPRASSPSHISCAICLLQNRTFHVYENFEHEKITWKPGAVLMSDAPTKSRLWKISRQEHYPIASFITRMSLWAICRECISDWLQSSKIIPFFSLFFQTIKMVTLNSFKIKFGKILLLLLLSL